MKAEVAGAGLALGCLALRASRVPLRCSLLAMRSPQRATPLMPESPGEALVELVRPSEVAGLVLDANLHRLAQGQGGARSLGGGSDRLGLGAGFVGELAVVLDGPSALVLQHSENQGGNLCSSHGGLLRLGRMTPRQSTTTAGCRRRNAHGRPER